MSTCSVYFVLENKVRQRDIAMIKNLIMTPRVLSKIDNRYPTPIVLTASCAAVTLTAPPLHHRMLNINVNVFKTRHHTGNVNEAHTKG